MGLPLWQPRVESDIPARPEAKNPAHARSRIRGSANRDRGTTAIRERPTWSTRQGETRTRERRRGLLQEMQEARMLESNAITNPIDPPLTADELDAPRRLRVFMERQQQIEDVMERMRSTYAETGVRQRVHIDLHSQPTPVIHYGDDRAVLREQLDTIRRLQAERDGRFNTAPGATDRAIERVERAERMESARASLGEVRQHVERFPTANDDIDVNEVNERVQHFRDQAANFTRTQSEHHRAGIELRARNQRRAQAEAAARVDGPRARLDGLGDRDRSLSPEGDNAWDTLLTTLTPDPQPPSVGSSFASVASAVASRTTANESSNTSLTGRDTGAEESTFEQPCDSDDEGEPVEFEVDLDEANASNEPSGAQANSYADAVRLGEYTTPSGTRTRNPPVPVDRLTYGAAGSGSGIDAVNARAPGIFNASEPGSGSGAAEPGTDDLVLQLVGGLGGMQHIVRNLVRREDIPNDWWVDAGLSRTLPRDDSPGDSSNNN
ncbi:hypothetical protein CONLIGDRAFT_140707 [Coniochaeta ligniaria NRRL 30616]|uniref:Uncharacterized protein n=1 Tax=Coniochaeta ligniaria NRRL 30616 TaxID=1408157 RepID=A0A1J7J1G9_9PEZI|nr:hypothetical protein CONLIGDRAFT_140707 [Coniochaeta ligniaria NRRL 30616]